MGEISITKLLVVAALVVLLFGTKKLRTLGGDLGAAIKGFKKAMNDDDAAAKKGADVDLGRVFQREDSGESGLTWIYLVSLREYISSFVIFGHNLWEVTPKNSL